MEVLQQGRAAGEEDVVHDGQAGGGQLDGCEVGHGVAGEELGGREGVVAAADFEAAEVGEAGEEAGNLVHVDHARLCTGLEPGVAAADEAQAVHCRHPADIDGRRALGRIGEQGERPLSQDGDRLDVLGQAEDDEGIQPGTGHAVLGKHGASA